MKKHISILLMLVLLTSCGTYNYSQFYNAHKNDMNATAFQMPKFLANVLSGLSPEINSLFGNVYGFKYLTLKDVKGERLHLINKEINSITNHNYTDIIRQNKEGYRLIISGIEKQGIFKKLIYYRFEDNNIYSFCLEGNFNSNDIKALSEKKEFNKLSTELLLKAPQITPINMQ